MLTMERRTWPRLYVDLLREAHTEGYSRPSREGETVEIGPAMLKVPAPVFACLQGRGGSTDFAQLEQLQYLAGLSPETLPLVAPRYARFREENGLWHGAYGPRLREQLPLVVNELTRHPFSRRAIAMIWTDQEMRYVTGIGGLPVPRDIPCTVSLTYWLGPDGALRSLAHMRSCDLWYGLYYDLPAFAFLQRAVARALNRACSLTYLSATSLHLYNQHLDRVRAVRPRILGPLVHPVVPSLAGSTPEIRFKLLQEWAAKELDKQVLEIERKKLNEVTV